MLYLNKPITCWAPVHFTGAHTKFMTSYCWVKNTYYLPWDDQVPMGDTEKRQVVPYYQWIPFILLAQVYAAQTATSGASPEKKWGRGLE